MKKKYNVTGMSCAACAAHVSKAVNDLDGYTCNVSLLTNSMEVTAESDIDDQKVIKAVQNAGYGVSIYQNEYLEKQNKKVKGKRINLIISIVLMVLIMYIAMGHMINALPFFLTGDLLEDNWSRADLGGLKEKNKQISSFDIALMIAENI